MIRRDGECSDSGGSCYQRTPEAENVARCPNDAHWPVAEQPTVEPWL